MKTAVERETIMKNKTRAGKHETRQDSNPLQESGTTTLSKRKLSSPTPEQIRQRAHEIYQARGDAPGRELDDWLQAERELKTKMGQLPEKNPAGTGDPFSPQG